MDSARPAGMGSAAPQDGWLATMTHSERSVPRSIATRVAVHCAVLAGAALAFVVSLAYWELSGALRERAHAELIAERDIIRNALADTSGIKAFAHGRQHLSALRSDHPGLNVVIFPLAGGAPLVAMGTEARELVALDLSQEWSGVREFEREAMSLAVTKAAVRLRDASAVNLVVAIDRSADRALLAAHGWRLLVTWLAAIVLIGVCAAALARRSIASLRTFTTQLAEISADQLGRRIAADTVPVELRELAVTFNDLLSRLDDAFRRLDTFSGDIAHELRSPVANLVTRTQLALSRPRSREEYLDTLESSAEELERLRRMVDDMLLLARTANPAARIARTSIDLREACEGLAEFFGISAQERGLTIEVSGQAATSGDPALVRRAVSNLLSNALRHAPQGSTVRLSVERDFAGHAVVRVENAGAAILPDMQSHIFDRFVVGPMTPESRSGTGLGLAIVRSIMQLHGGAVGVEAPSGGPIVFWLRFSNGAA